MKEYRVACRWGDGKWDYLSVSFYDESEANEYMREQVSRQKDRGFTYTVEQREVTEWEPVND